MSYCENLDRQISLQKPSNVIDYLIAQLLKAKHL